MTQDDRTLQEFIERELAHAAEVEPIAGFEERLLSRLQTGEAGSRRRARAGWWWLGGTVLAAAAALLIAVFVGRPATTAPPTSDTRSASVAGGQTRTTATPPLQGSARAQGGSNAPASPSSVPGSTLRVPRVRVAVPAVVAHDMPRQATFPTSVPLSTQEGLLLVLAARPDEAAEFLEAQRRPIEPLQVREIVIAPLDWSEKK